MFKYVFLFLGIYTSQFYIMDSGKPQISHVLLLLFSIFYYFKQRSENRIGTAIRFFAIYATTINLIYFFIKGGETSYLMFPIYLIYNILIYDSIIKFLLLEKNRSKSIIAFSFFLSLITLVVLYYLGLGRYLVYPRFNGFFNDPNQMAFWALCAFSIIAFFSKRKLAVLSVSFICCLIICVSSFSRSSFVGLVFTSLGLFVFYFFSNRVKIKSLFLLLSLLLSFSFIIPSLDNSETMNYLIQRFESTDVDSQMETRGYYRIVENPEYLLFGAGQGEQTRFGKTTEIHSTWAGILFYYGIFGLLLFIYFVYRIFKGLNLVDKLIFLGPLFYSFSTFGARTPIFYIFLAVATYTSLISVKSNSEIYK